MSEFEIRYTRLNSAQKKAVDKIEGPVMVVAGPGTGKTELLSMRVANILKHTDVDPQNILCLTYTESGAAAMRERLISLMGQAAYRVGIYTFHSFGSMVMSRYSEYFYSALDMKPADELTTYEVLHDIFSNLPHTNPLSSRYGDDFSFLSMAQRTISDLKRAGISPDELRAILAQNELLLDEIEPIFSEFFDSKISKNMADKADTLLTTVENTRDEVSPVSTILPLRKILIDSLRHMLDELTKTDKTVPLTRWKNTWLTVNRQKKYVFKSRSAHTKLRALSYIYFDYLLAMQERRVYDYDDMILQLLHKLEGEPELRFTLQEQYHYFLVDEFQDTNGAQLRILHALTDNEVLEGQPNIMVVGDDDQAIYRFQGADISNILDFTSTYRKVSVVILKENYRSSETILSHARDVITQGEERLENTLSLDKQLIPHHSPRATSVQLVRASHTLDEYSSIAKKIASSFHKNNAPSIAVIARGHNDIRAFLPYLSAEQVPFSYEQSDDVLSNPSIVFILSIARLLPLISSSHIRDTNALLSEILAHPCFNIPPQTLFDISVESYKTHVSWLELMLQRDDVRSLAEALISLAFAAQQQNFQITFDQLLGSTPINLSKGEHVMPLKNYFFSPQALASDPELCVTHLESLQLILRHFEQYNGATTPSLKEFISYINTIQKVDIHLRRSRSEDDTPQTVRVMTAHGSKGLEFDDVYIINVTDETWGERARDRKNHISYPENLPIGMSGDRLDEKIRLLYVAMTRARNNLCVSYSDISRTEKTTLKFSVLETDGWQEEQLASPDTIQRIENSEISWQDSIVNQHSSLSSALMPLLKNYKLSATHLNNFIDVTVGGPRYFLLQNLLHFPQSLHPSAAMGSSVHIALKKAHQHFSHHGDLKPNEDVVYDFREELMRAQLADNDFEFQLKRGSDALQVFLSSSSTIFHENDIVERDLRPLELVVETARITGILDCVRVDHKEKTIDIIDYKTGKPSRSWRGKDDREKIKLHKYRQQLLFYKLLIESIPEFTNYSVRSARLSFIEPDDEGIIHALEIDWDDTEITRFKKLIHAVWQHIMAADFAETRQYDQTYKGILAFEKDLLNE
jgi:DNA helicase-2/ATP-dependent DNA helicase PcrA